jgi:hypothetical protein
VRGGEIIDVTGAVFNFLDFQCIDDDANAAGFRGLGLDGWFSFR